MVGLEGILRNENLRDILKKFDSPQNAPFSVRLTSPGTPNRVDVALHLKLGEYAEAQSVRAWRSS
jgi:hypothetical protein